MWYLLLTNANGFSVWNFKLVPFIFFFSFSPPHKINPNAAVENNNEKEEVD